MGEAWLDRSGRILSIIARLVFYGNAADKELANQVAADVASHWNEPGASVLINGNWYQVIFNITGVYAPDLSDIDVYSNTDPRNNYFRIEEFADGNISFVDGIGCNTGYFKLDNLLHNSTTAAHEFGHSLGLEHPESLDIRGKGAPGIMYPRGTIVDPPFQYDPAAQPLQPGGTLNPFTRKVLQDDIEALRLHKLPFSENGSAIVGGFSSVWHDAHER